MGVKEADPQLPEELKKFVDANGCINPDTNYLIRFKLRGVPFVLTINDRKHDKDATPPKKDARAECIIVEKVSEFVPKIEHSRFPESCTLSGSGWCSKCLKLTAFRIFAEDKLDKLNPAQ